MGNLKTGTYMGKKKKKKVDKKRHKTQYNKKPAAELQMDWEGRQGKTQGSISVFEWDFLPA